MGKTYFFTGEHYTRAEIFSRYGIVSPNISRTHKHLMKSFTPLVDPHTGQTTNFVFFTVDNDYCYNDSHHFDEVHGEHHHKWVKNKRLQWPGVGTEVHIMTRVGRNSRFLYRGAACAVYENPTHVWFSGIE